MASGWTMEREAPDRLAYDCLQLFALDADGKPSVQALNLPLTGRGAAGAAA
jgi:hypothetical protein